MITRRLIMAAARRLASDPVLRREASKTAGTLYRKAAPTAASAGRHLADSFRETRAEADPLDDPVGFAKRLKRKLLPPE
jgi:hypothetical protein